jgi:hypothetical protein
MVVSPLPRSAWTHDSTRSNLPLSKFIIGLNPQRYAVSTELLATKNTVFVISSLLCMNVDSEPERGKTALDDGAEDPVASWAMED